MRTKKAIINSSVNIIAFIVAFIPNLIIRKIFLNSLGSEMLGLNSLYTNLIGWLSIIELGVGSAIIFSLYKPYADNNLDQVRAYLRFYRKFYRIIGTIILTLGILIIPFLSFFIENGVNMKIASLGFILFLINTFISYMLSDRLCILNVAQEAYKITIGTTVSKLIIIIIQAITLKIYPSFLLFIVVQVCINLIYYIFMNIYIVKTHPWINSGKEELDNEVKRNLLGNIRAMFMHKIGGLIVYNTDNIVISKFIGLGALANFSNYQVIISAFQTVVSTALKGITASIGNLLSTENKGKAYIVHKRIFFLNFWVISFIIITLYNTLNQFIALWVGQKYLIDKGTFIIVLINAYFSSMRGSVEQFQNGSGNFRRDRYAPLFEGVINLVSSIILVKYIGLKGVFIGTLISNITVIFWTKPYVIYKYVFDRSVRDYFIMYFKYLFIGLVPLILTNYITYSIQTIYTFTNFIINCVVNILVINIFYIFIFMKNDNFKYYVNLIKKLIQK